MTAFEMGSQFRHMALVYRSAGQMVERIKEFLQPALAAGEPALVAVESRKLPPLRAALGEGAIRFAPMEEVGRNPGRIISIWHDFLGDHETQARTVWGIGEPIYPARDPEETVECQIHERLLNLAFAKPSVSFNLACPYDAMSLPVDVIEESGRSHPWPSEIVNRPDGDLLSRPLPLPPDEGVYFVPFYGSDLDWLRGLLAEKAKDSGVEETRLSDVVLAISEIAVNSIVYSGGGDLRLWEDGNRFICEIRDQGIIEDPLVGRRRPRSIEERGRGIWLAHQLADLVQLRSDSHGTTVRLTFSRNPTS